jgi:hypothetical protein
MRVEEARNPGDQDPGSYKRAETPTKRSGGFPNAELRSDVRFEKFEMNLGGWETATPAGAVVERMAPRGQ